MTGGPIMQELQRHQGSDSLVRNVTLDASPKRVFEAITTVEGLRGRWTPFVCESLVG
jgi:uncharacterized protein YndB with AHSA1/START domain